MTELIPDAETNFWTKGRLKTYEHWPFQSSELRCNPQHMAAAGFVCIGGTDEPDLVECFICSKKLDGWEKTDDPWKEHSSHQPNCPYVLLNKQDEKSWTIEELFSMVKQYFTKECMRQKEIIMDNLKTKQASLSSEILEKCRKSRKSKKSIKSIK